MAWLQLPHTRGCLVCGRDNPHGLGLDLMVDPESGNVSVGFFPADFHIGFDNIVHGGVLATVFDEAMVWAASWSAKQFCVCAELTVRYLRPVAVGMPINFVARVQTNRPRLISTETEARDRDDRVMATASGKYVRMAADQNAAMLRTFLPHPATVESSEAFRIGPVRTA